MDQGLLVMMAYYVQRRIWITANLGSRSMWKNKKQRLHILCQLQLKIPLYIQTGSRQCCGTF